MYPKNHTLSTINKAVICVIFLVALANCSSNDDLERPTSSTTDTPTTPPDTPPTTINYADIDFSSWKVTLPVDENNNGGPDEYQPADLINFGYQTLAPVQPFMYDDTDDESLVFYTYPDISTTNSSFSRTELRELINPSNSRENWTLLEGGTMQGRLKVSSISENSNSGDTYHKVIVMQIHGIISEEDMDIHGFASNNGPPLIKIYWKDGFVWSHKKSLVDETTSGDDLLDTSSSTWYDIKENLGYVGFGAFDFKIVASDARITVTLNNETPFVYEDVSLDKWPFENYFKAGNYLTTTDANAFSYVKYYSLYLTH
ncbi:polysaccharide lyase family 7 protein [Kordia sp. YSTF-M3]|uniref:Polysaccharide lyase family 7 protein n=1 Tax=Kordia aestuariivivens TaxID=2759037 RepID=A0ABR7Q4X2_9FLAO|nr:polysaccharide lyase family 7 protein [Kordia aestuariivivens]MBC8753394.1 polysaccharide lyase family 7 protein [Kordia aestuariivivens]